MTIFFIFFGFILSSLHSPPAMLWPEKAVIPPICSKFNFVWGGREEVASFTNTTEKVATLLTSTVASTEGKGHFFLRPKTWIQPPFRAHLSTQKVTEVLQGTPLRNFVAL